MRSEAVRGTEVTKKRKSKMKITIKKRIKSKIKSMIRTRTPDRRLESYS